MWRVEHKSIEHIILYNINTEFYHINIIFNNKNEENRIQIFNYIT